MKCVSYTRTLPWKNHQSKLTIAEQNQRIAAYLAEHKELDLQKKYSDRKNDEKARAAFDQMTNDGVERKFDCIIVASMYYCGPDFPAVRQAIKETLYATGIDLIVLEEGLDTRAVSRKEVEDYFEAKRCEMHAEIMFAWRKKQGAGFRLTNSVPFGYIRRNGESNMIKDEEVAPYLSEAFSRYASGRKMRDIAKWLNEQGVEPPMKHKKRILGKPYDEEPDQWTTDMLRCLFRNPTYTGAAANGSRQIIAENCHEPYITKEQFHAFPCNLREGENKISIRKSYKKPNPLAKHIVCTCGRALCWHKDKKTGEELFYCRYCRAHKENGKNLKVPAATIYKNVMDALELEHLEEEKLAAAIQQGAGKKAIEVVRAERSVQMKSVLAELNMEQFRRVPLYESYMANEITEEQYHAELMDYEEAHRKLNEQLTAIMEDVLYGDIQKEEQGLKEAHKKASRRKTLMEQELKNLKGEKMRMYEEYAAGTLLLDTYKQKKQECDRRISEVQEQIEQSKVEESTKSVVPETVRAAAEQAENFLNGTRLTASMVSAFIENVFVYDGGRIVVRFKYEQSIQDAVKALHTG